MTAFDDNDAEQLFHSRESYFLLAQPKGEQPYVITTAGEPYVCSSLEKAAKEAKVYLDDRPNEDLEIRLRRISISPAGRITRGERTYVSEQTDVSGVERVVSSYHVGEEVIAEYKGLEAEEPPSPQSLEITRGLTVEFGEELRAIQALFPQYDHFGVQFGDPTAVYLATSRTDLIKISTALALQEKRPLPFILNKR